MTFVFLLVAILLVGVLLVGLGAVLLFSQKNKLAGFIVLGIGLLMTLASILGSLSLVITTRTMG